MLIHHQELFHSLISQGSSAQRGYITGDRMTGIILLIVVDVVVLLLVFRMIRSSVKLLQKSVCRSEAALPPAAKPFKRRKTTHTSGWQRFFFSPAFTVVM